MDPINDPELFTHQPKVHSGSTHFTDDFQARNLHEQADYEAMNAHSRTKSNRSKARALWLLLGERPVNRSPDSSW